MQRLKGLALIFIATIAGCATLSEEECLTADWHAIGYEDGANGERTTRVRSYREACAKYGVSPSLTDYRTGHKEGLITFCTASSGYNRAVNGNQYSGVCPDSLEPDFLEGYQFGREIYQVTSNIEYLERRQYNNEREQIRIGELLQDKEAELFNPEKSEHQRRRIYEEISRLNEQQGSLQRERDLLIHDLANTRTRLLELRRRSAFY